MTIVEMLDVLENEIARLRADRTRLASALEDAERRVSAETEGVRPKVQRRKRAKRPRKKIGSKTGRKSVTPSLAGSPPDTTPERTGGAAPTGKRVALGRGLAQLRRAPAPDHQKPPDQTT